ncbi:GNAT family N-acetyltransferase [Arthrobacter sp. ok362]|uniref:GNAT family N-acetyltransferase n=1 Tax=Arthrobacter sp. ok362 TaxID=1761745 RepID=UPI000B803A95|nr:GNAT family N-acetyltransferase [Arthrobacter sp. ok362]
MDVLGHIGYGIRPSARGRGLATQALREMIALGRDRGPGRVLLVCFAGNHASVKTIERCGGVLESAVRTGSGEVLRYWIEV